MNCENCETKITFWMTQRQPTPFRYKCSTCKAVYRVSTPGMPVIVLGVIGVTLCLSLVLGFGWDILGAYFAIPFLVFILGVGFGIEVLLFNYISMNGKFTRVDVEDGEATEEVEEDGGAGGEGDDEM